MSALVNLYSDTQTRPTPAMRRAMAEAEVGDEQRFEDPTVTSLCSRVASLLGFEAAVFLPSVEILPALIIAVPSAFVLALIGISMARRARFRVERSLYRSGERTVRFGRFLVWSGLYFSLVGALALAFYSALRASG